MKALFVIPFSILLSTSGILYGQDDIYDMPGSAPYSIYMGSSIGLNSPNGFLGFYVETPVSEKLALNGHLGIGIWGLKYTLGGRLYKQYPSKLYYSASFSGNSGINNMELELETSPGESNIVHLDLKRAQTINLSIGYHFSFVENKLRINIESGYAIPLTPDPWVITDNQSITDLSNNMLDLISPGGLILSIGLSIGFFQ